VTTFSHTIARNSPFQPIQEWHWFGRLPGKRTVAEDSLTALSRVTYANINHLQRKELYRGFECLSLRQTVWTAENSRLSLL